MGREAGEKKESGEGKIAVLRSGAGTPIVNAAVNFPDPPKISLCAGDPGPLPSRSATPWILESDLAIDDLMVLA